MSDCTIGIRTHEEIVQSHRDTQARLESELTTTRAQRDRLEAYCAKLIRRLNNAKLRKAARTRSRK